MTLKKLFIGAFGKLKDKEISLEPGLNVIYGENGSGKSTVMQFIKAAFYGFERKGRASVLPWDGSAAGGFVSYESGGRELLTQCKFGKTVRGDSSVTTDNISGSEISKDFMGKSVFDMSAAAFSKTAFVLAGSAIDSKGDDEIAEKLSNLRTSGDEAVSYSAAEADIGAAMAKLVAKRGGGGRIQQCEAAIEEIKTALNAEYAKADGAAGVKDRLSKAYAAEKEIESNIVFLKKAVEAERFARLKNIKDLIEKSGEIPDLSGAAAAAEKIRGLKSEAEALKTAADGFSQKAADEPEISETDFNAAAEMFYKTSSAPAAFYAAAVLAAGFAVLGFFNPYFFLGTLLLAAAAVMLRPKKSKIGEIIGKYGFSDFESFRAHYLNGQAQKKIFENAKSEAERAKAALGEMLGRLSAAENAAKSEFGSAQPDELEKKCALAEKKSAEKAAYEKSYAAILGGDDYAELEKLYGNFETVYGAREKLEQKERELREINAEISRLERQSGALSAAHDPCELERQKAELCEKLGKLKSDYECLNIVMDTLSDAYDVMENEFGAKLNGCAGEILKKITADDFSVRMNKSYGVKLMENSEMHDAKDFSTGLFEQVYLSYRLAMLSVMDCPCPAFLDDSLMTYDDLRAQNTLRFLKNCGRQIILFTCRSRDAQLAEDFGANVIKI